MTPTPRGTHGGNRIPDSHLAKFSIGAPRKPNGLPSPIDRFLESL